MDDMFSKRAWCIPVATHSSTGLFTNAENSSAMEVDSGCISDGNKINTFFYNL